MANEVIDRVSDESDISRVMRILLVEDEPHLAESIAENLEAESYVVDTEMDGAQGLQKLLARDYDLAILDVMLPKLDGFSICRGARERGVETPVLFLTARGDVDDRVEGLRAGGDDYLAKPFHLEELLLRVGAILRRVQRESGEVERVTFAGNTIDFRSFRGTSWNGQPVELSRKEALILKVLALRRGEVVSRDEILDRVWGLDAYPSSRTIDNFIVRLRKLLERDPEHPEWIVTVRGVGYRLEAD